MEVLFTFLNWTASFSHVDEESGSKMDVHNLATVMAPNILHMGNQDVPVDDSFLGIEAVHSLIEYNETFCEIPEDISLILNDSSLFSSSAEMTTKEILKRYGDRNKGQGPAHTPTITDPSAEEMGSPRSQANRPAHNPVATRVDTDPSQANAWQNESSVRHVKDNAELGGQGALGTPQMPYTMRNDSTESHGSPSRKDKFGEKGQSKAVGVT